MDYHVNKASKTKKAFIEINILMCLDVHIVKKTLMYSEITNYMTSKNIVCGGGMGKKKG